jgi:hypothetical protein
MKFTLELFQKFFLLQKVARQNVSLSDTFISILENKSTKVFSTNDLTTIAKTFDVYNEANKQLFSLCLNEMELNVPFTFYNFTDFNIFNQIFGIFLEFSKYDIHSLRRLFILSHLFSLSLPSPDLKASNNSLNSAVNGDLKNLLTTKYSLRNHSVWNNLPFWIDLTKLIITEDIEKFENVLLLMSKSHKANLIHSYYHLTNEQFLFYFLFSRLDSIIHSMKSLVLSKDLIENYYQNILLKVFKTKELFSFLNSDYQNGLMNEFNFQNSFSFKNHLLSLVLQRLSNYHPHDNNVNGNTGQHYPTFYFHPKIWNQFCDNHSLGTFKINNPEDDLNITDSRCRSCYHYYEIGYSSLLQLIYLPILFKLFMKDVVYVNNLVFLRKNSMDFLRTALNSTGSNTSMNSAITMTMEFTESVCFCGHHQSGSCASSWKLIGNIAKPLNLLPSILQKMKELEKDYEENAIIEEKHVSFIENDLLFMNFLPKILCEYCYRQLFLYYHYSQYTQNNSGSTKADNDQTTSSSSKKQHGEQKVGEGNYYYLPDIIPIGSAAITFLSDEKELIAANYVVQFQERLKTTFQANIGKLKDFYNHFMTTFGKKHFVMDVSTPPPPPLAIAPTRIGTQSDSYDKNDTLNTTTTFMTVGGGGGKGEERGGGGTSERKKGNREEKEEKVSKTKNDHHSNQEMKQQQSSVKSLKGKGLSLSFLEEPTTISSPSEGKYDSIESNLIHSELLPTLTSVTTSTGETILLEEISENPSLKVMSTDSMKTDGSMSKKYDLASPAASSVHTVNTVFQEQEFQNFLQQLWNGITVTLIYSNHPYVAKTRVIFLRSNSQLNDNFFKSKISFQGSTSSAKNLTHQQIINFLQTKNVPLYLGWGHLKERENLTYDTKKSVSLYDVKGMKIGTKQYKNCLKIITEQQIIMLKIENDVYFDFVIKGLAELFSNVSTSFVK